MTNKDWIKVTTKTKTEIKNSVRKLKRHTSDVCKEWQTVDTGGGRAKRDAEVKEMRSVSVQVDLADINKELEEKKRRTLNKIQAAIERNDTFDKLSEILDEKWPQDIYKITETEGVTEKIGHHGDYAILFDPSKVENNKLIEKLMLKYDGLAYLGRRVQDSSERIEELYTRCDIE
ncbi:hypothetical protein QE152_g38366 [Popillia japonica]|uniref:Uncharacterized protein n=1 Tax=Popillia japonica TaxID=7064 RepID=A0AAW1HYQ5_POPJA